jgi:[ribosomal protein S18]-alanine N-acetyltransferase
LFKEFQNVFLCVSSFNKKAEKLYRKLGYKKIGVLEDFFVTGYDEIIFRKSRGAIFPQRNK